MPIFLLLNDDEKCIGCLFALATCVEGKSEIKSRIMIIGMSGELAFKFTDIAKVSWNEGQWGHIGRYDGKRAVFVTANMKEGYNILQVRKAIGAAVDRPDGSSTRRLTDSRLLLPSSHHHDGLGAV